MIDLSQRYVAAVLQEAQMQENVRLALEAKQKGATALEYRADLIGGTADEHLKLLNALKEEVGLPIVLTIRHEKERGKFKGSEMERLELFHSLIPLVDIVDIELTAYDPLHDIRELVIGFAHKEFKRVLASVHDFENTPSLDEMERYAQTAREMGADAVKMAFMPGLKKDILERKQDVIRLSRFTLRNKILPAVTVSMDKIGQPSRYLNPALGSILTYGPVGDKPVAPGQIEIKRLAESVENVGGPIKKNPAWIKRFLENVWNGMDLAPEFSI